MAVNVNSIFHVRFCLSVAIFGMMLLKFGKVEGNPIHVPNQLNHEQTGDISNVEQQDEVPVTGFEGFGLILPSSSSSWSYPLGKELERSTDTNSGTQWMLNNHDLLKLLLKPQQQYQKRSRYLNPTLENDYFTFNPMHSRSSYEKRQILYRQCFFNPIACF